MEFKELLRKRHSVRTYIKKPIEEEKLLNILEAGRISQSARNKQPWEVMILKNDKKQKISDLLKTLDNPYMKKQADYIDECDTLLLVYTDKENENSVDELVSLGAFIQDMCLAAFDEGLGCLWCRMISYAQEKVNSLLNIENKYLVSGILLGYYDCELTDRPRKSLDEIIIK